MNLPNYITLIRVVLIPFFIGLMIYGHYLTALFVFVAAGITDALDGMIARITKNKTELGAFLDPMADKLLLVSAFVTLGLLGKIPVWLVIVVVSRDVIIVLGSLAVYFIVNDLKARPSIVGKMTTVLQLTVIAVTLAFMNFRSSDTWIMPLLDWTTAAFTVWSGMQYVGRGIKIVG